MQNNYELFYKGLNDFFANSQSRLSDEDIAFADSLLINVLDLVDTPSSLLDMSKSVIFNYISKNDSSEAYNISSWKKEIDESSNLISAENISSSHWDLFYDHRRRFNGEHQPHRALCANKISGARSWSSIGTSLASSMQYSSATSSFILSEWISQSGEGFVEYTESHCFGKVLHHKTRGVFYAALSGSGLLTKKQARKMRSEASSAASCLGLASLIKNKDLYSNYDELLTQFMDTRYEDVAHELAKNAPIHMISYLLGSEHYWAKSVAEKRFNEHYKSKEDE
jgi:hypothetical protein